MIVALISLLVLPLQNSVADGDRARKDSNRDAILKHFTPLGRHASSQTTPTLRLGHTKLLFSVFPRRKSRGMVEIMACILETCLEGTKKTQIMYRANLTSRSINRYLELLVEQGMLEKLEMYRTTVKGRRYLEYFEGILNLLGKCDADDEIYPRFFNPFR